MIAHLANGLPANKWLPPHPMEELVNTPLLPEETPATLNSMACLQSDTICNNLVHNPIPSDHAVLCALQKPVQSTDICLDEFIMAIQGSETVCLQHLWHLLYLIDTMFRPIDQYDSEHHKLVLLKKKALKGDAYLCTRKLLLGWMLDTAAHTLELPPHQKEQLQQIFDDLHGQTRMGITLWQKVLGKPQSMAIGIPGSRGLFSMLQEGLKYRDKGRIHTTQVMRDQLTEFEYLKRDLDQQPTHLSELVLDHPVAIGPHDASVHGMGGVWLPAIMYCNLKPLLWCSRFPATITAQLISYENPIGTITNLDLELAGAIAHQDVLQQEVNCAAQPHHHPPYGQYSYLIVAT